MARELSNRGVKGKHFITETARNGADPAPADGNVCNPLEAGLGRAPKLVFTGQFDGYVWIKHPGESDGQSSPEDPADTCHGGPPPGSWWPQGALRLLRKGS